MSNHELSILGENLINLENPHENYPGKPILLGSAAEAIDNGTIHWTRSGNAILRLPSGEQKTIIPEHQLDLIDQSFDAVEANLQPGTPYEAYLQAERAKCNEARIKAEILSNPRKLAYGSLVYYPHIPRVAWFAPPRIKHLALLARNEFQLQDPDQKLTYDEQREIFGSQIIGVFGASVASLAARRIVSTLRLSSQYPHAARGGMKISDFDTYNDAVQGRRSHGLLSVNENKAIATAREMHEADPWLPLWVYPEGVDPYGNFDEFIHGNPATHEPGIMHGVEAIDRVDDKFEITRRLRDAGIDNWRISDIGVAYQVEWLPNSKFPHHPLTIGVSDSDLEASLDTALRHASKETWFDFAFKLIGPHWERVPEFRDFIKDKIRSPFASAIPQIAIASEGAANLVALGMASTLLGWEWPNRYFVDLRTGTLIREWLHVEENRLTRETVSQNIGMMSIEQIDITSGKTLESTICHLQSGTVIRT